jgi:hypothetical protein
LIGFFKYEVFCNFMLLAFGRALRSQDIHLNRSSEALLLSSIKGVQLADLPGVALP